MKKFAKESGQGLLEYALILVLVAIIVIAVLMSISGPRSKFIEAIDNGIVVINGNKIALGQFGHPQSVDSEIEVVNNFLGPLYTLEDYPEKYLVTECSNIYLDEPDTVVFAASPVNETVAELIDIQAPAQSGGYVQVCVPEGLSDVPVYLWSGAVEP